MPEDTFESSMKRLEEIVQRLEGGDMPLEESLKAFEEGMKLLSFCSKKLEEVEKKVSLLVKEQDGTSAVRPFEPMSEEEEP
jgi:exodeoxyribonuclease VII small subunit